MRVSICASTNTVASVTAVFGMCHVSIVPVTGLVGHLLRAAALGLKQVSSCTNINTEQV